MQVLAGTLRNIYTSENLFFIPQANGREFKFYWLRVRSHLAF